MGRMVAMDAFSSNIPPVYDVSQNVLIVLSAIIWLTGRFENVPWIERKFAY